MLLHVLTEVELFSKDLEYEYGTSLDQTGKVLRRFIGTATGIMFSKHDTKYLQRAIFTHNHPSGRCFSGEDIMSLAFYDFLELRAVTPLSTYYSLKKKSVVSDAYRLTSAFLEEEKRLYQVAIDEEKEFINSYGFIDDFMDVVYNSVSSGVERWLLDNAEEYGYLFSRGSINDKHQIDCSG